MPVPTRLVSPQNGEKSFGEARNSVPSLGALFHWAGSSTLCVARKSICVPQMGPRRIQLVRGEERRVVARRVVRRVVTRRFAAACLWASVLSRLRPKVRRRAYQAPVLRMKSWRNGRAERGRPRNSRKTAQTTGLRKKHNPAPLRCVLCLLPTSELFP